VDTRGAPRRGWRGQVPEVLFSAAGGDQRRMMFMGSSPWSSSVSVVGEAGYEHRPPTNRRPPLHERVPVPDLIRPFS